MARKFTVEIEDERVLADLHEIAALSREAPEELLLRAFQEWVRLREDIEDVAVAREVREEYRRDGGISHEDIGAELGTKRRSA